MLKNIVNKIKELFELYSFNIEDESMPGKYLVFSCRKGYFNNVEIVVFDSTFDTTTLVEEYRKSGYAVKVTDFESLEIVHSSLFKGFFDVINTKSRLANNYNEFCKSQSEKKLLSEYKYIPCSYINFNNICSDNLISFIIEKVMQPSASLTIIEAPAGFGKTCTSYEIMKAISEYNDESICILAELSKNRKAAIFRYVLYSEIDAIFNGLKYNLVESEIKAGRLPVIIDGFDELLSKSIDEIKSDSVSENKNDVQSMLKTISQLLSDDSKAKIILTSRKSSIFTGQIFDEWIEQNNLSCDISRIELGQPKIYEWLGDKKAGYVKTNMPELFNVANPLLLNTLLNIDEESLIGLDSENIINKYFESILSREQERQSLKMGHKEQMVTMKKLASAFVQYDITAEESKYIREILEDIMNESIDDYISRYSEYGVDENVPDKDQFLMKLVHHAFLDRIHIGKNEIGFINDFTFGYLIGQALLDCDLSSSDLGYKHIDLLATAYQSCKEDTKNKLFNIISDQVELLNESQILQIDQKLLNRPSRSFKDVTFDSFIFDLTFEFPKDKMFENCIFSNCSFFNNVFSVNSFKECRFYNCSFNDIQVIDTPTENKNLIFIKCKGFEIFSKIGASHVSTEDTGKNYQKILLEQFWKTGKDKAEVRCGFNTVYRGLSTNLVKEVDKALDELISKGFIVKKSVCYELNFSHINEIKEILGR